MPSGPQRSTVRNSVVAVVAAAGLLAAAGVVVLVVLVVLVVAAALAVAPGASRAGTTTEYATVHPSPLTAPRTGRTDDSSPFGKMRSVRALVEPSLRVLTNKRFDTGPASAASAASAASSGGGASAFANTTTEPSSDKLGELLWPTSGVPLLSTDTTSLTIAAVWAPVGAPTASTTPIATRPNTPMVPTRAQAENESSDVR